MTRIGGKPSSAPPCRNIFSPTEDNVRELRTRRDENGDEFAFLLLSAADPLARSIRNWICIWLSVGLWLILACMVGFARTKGPFPSISNRAVWIALPVSFAAMIVLGNLLQAGFNGRWMIFPGVFSPALIGLFVLALWFTPFRPIVQSATLNCALWGLILLFSFAILVAGIRHKQAESARSHAAQTP